MFTLVLSPPKPLLVSKMLRFRGLIVCTPTPNSHLRYLVGLIENPLTGIVDLPAGWCVWASTKQASFLHGRFVWAEWGVDELEGMKDWLSSNPGFLRMGLQGVEPVTPAVMFKLD